MAKKRRRTAAAESLPSEDDLRQIMRQVLMDRSAVSPESAIWYFTLVDETLQALNNAGHSFSDTQRNVLIGIIRGLVNGREFETTVDGKVYL